MLCVIFGRQKKERKEVIEMSPDYRTEAQKAVDKADAKTQKAADKARA